MERGPYGSNGNTTGRRIYETPAEELETCYTCNGRVSENIKRQFNKKRRNPQGLKAGDHVWLENKNIQLNQPSKKLDNKRYGPFRITKDVGSGVFQLELPEGWMIHNIFNEDLLVMDQDSKG